VLEIHVEPRKKKKLTSPETGKMRLSAASPAEARRDLTRDGDGVAGRDVTGGGDVKKLRVRVWDLRVGSAVAAGVGEDRWSAVVAGVEEDRRSCGGRGLGQVTEI
jgi:hypothetical protein